MWNLIIEIVKKKDENKKPILQTSHENELVDINTDTHKICANIFNNYFVAVGEKIENQIQNDKWDR